MYRYQKAGKIILLSGLTLLILCSLPFVSKLFIISLEDTPALVQEKIKANDAQAIIILGGGSYLNSPEYGEDTISDTTLVRVRYGAYLQNQTQLPLLVTGGNVYSWIKTTEADNMKKVLTKQFHVPVQWTESRSRNTWENALYSYEILAKENKKKIILVTHAMHMKRAILSFEAAGFEVIPAPLSFNNKKGLFSLSSFIPSAGAMSKINRSLHEVLGIIWYRLRYL